MITELELERRESLDWWGTPLRLTKYDDERITKDDKKRRENTRRDS